MAESYSRIQSRIAQLQRQAESLRRTEMEGVVKKIKVAIEAYGIRPEDLFGTGVPSSKRAGRKSKAAGDDARFSDADGNTWGGRGPRPKWLRDAIAAGKSLGDFEGGKPAAPAKAPASPPARKRGASGGGKGIAIKYRDGENTWTGRGSQPRWLRAALGEGKTLDQFAV